LRSGTLSARVISVLALSRLTLGAKVVPILRVH
jgi:hypothetical protein